MSGAAKQSLALFAQTNLSSIVTQLRKSRDDVRASVATNNFENPMETRK